MLAPSVPEAFVSSLVGPGENGEAAFLVPLVLAFINAAVSPPVLTATVHHGLPPVSPERPLVGADVSASAVDLVLKPTTGILGAVCPRVETMAVFPPAKEVPDEFRAIRPLLRAEAMLPIRDELPRVGGALAMHIHAKAVGAVVVPQTCVSVAVLMREPAVPASHVSRPLAEIPRTIGPRHGAEAIAFVAKPLAVVDRAAAESVALALTSGGTVARRRQLRQLVRLGHAIGSPPA
mmetsp:Transcript_96844/g.278673  ORF Transcript_96844/g.278673 Transcript_96844/m.278673 type:complete len:235 (-) Transcript_96844:394-1098(-)